MKFLPAAQKILPKKGPNHAKGELKINSVDLKKRSTKFFNFFFENAPPLEKILDPPLVLSW